ncbi:MAG: MFS transporter [Planctomycetota bacterium]|jgi:MFS family permease
MELALSRRNKLAGQSAFTKASTYNAAGFGFAGLQIFSLLALSYGADDFQMGIIYAGLYLVNFVSVLIPPLLGGFETTAIARRSFMVRSVAAGFAPLLLFFDSNQTKIWGVIVIYYFWLVARSFFMGPLTMIYKAVTTRKDMPQFIANLFSYFNVGYLITTVIGYLIIEFSVKRFGWSGEEKTFIFIITLGFICNMVGIYYFLKMPRTGYLTEGTFASIWQAAKDIKNDENLRASIIINFFITMIAVNAAYIISYMKNVAGFDSAQIFLMTVIGGLSSICMTRILKIVGIKISRRLLLLSAFTLCLIVSLVWAFAESIGFSSVLSFSFLYIFTSFGLSWGATVNVQFQTASMPKKRGIQVTCVYQIFTSAAALITISSSKFLISWSENNTISYGHQYTPVFLTWSLLCVVVILLAAFIVKHYEAKSLRNELSSLSPSNLFSIYQLYRQEDQPDEVKRYHQMEGVMRKPTDTGRKALDSWISSVDFSRRFSALRTLNTAPDFEHVDKVLAEAKAVDSPIRVDAITTLGFIGDKRASSCLEDCLKDPSPRVRASTIKTMIRLGEKVPEELILSEWDKCITSRSKIHILIGLTLGDYKEIIKKILIAELQHKPSIYWTSALFSNAADVFNKRETLLDIFEEDNKTPGEGLSYLLAEFPGVFEDEENLKKLFHEKNYSAIEDLIKKEKSESPAVIFDNISALGCLLLYCVTKERDLDE